MYQLSLGGSGGWQRVQLTSARRQRCQRLRRSAAAGDAPLQRGSYFDRIAAAGLQGPAKAAMTSGSLSALGDLLAQWLGMQMSKSAGKQAPGYDPMRTARMFGFGFCFYGPFQHLWYNLLDWSMPVKNFTNFASKVSLNQLVLAPLVLCVVFTWNLGLTGQGSAAIGDKIQNDLLPSLQNGWKFWIPAASLNFYCIPVQRQVLYMSCCSVLWTAYLSYASTNAVAAPKTA